jgi:hypothetical protein
MIPPIIARSRGIAPATFVAGNLQESIHERARPI